MNTAIDEAYFLADSTRNIPYKNEGIYTLLQLPKNCPDTNITVVILKTKNRIHSSITNPIPSIGKTAFASSTESEKFNSSFAVDTSSLTSWKAAKGQNKGWLMVDLGTPISIGSIALSEVVNHTGKNIKAFSLDYKNEKEEWTTIVKGNTLGEVFQTSFKPIIIRYVRLNILDADKEPQIKDWQMFYWN
jgi:hypothetical protein